MFLFYEVTFFKKGDIIQGGTIFKGGHYLRKYGILKPTGCESVVPQYIGDGWCDDENNNNDCNFDGGDCCGPNVGTQYCTQCICYDE